MIRFAGIFLFTLVALFALELTPPGQEYFVVPWTAAVAHVTTYLMAMFDPAVLSQGATIYNPKTGFGITIVAGCNGVEAMIVLVAGILAFPAPWLHRLAGLAVGVLAIQLLNLVRIISLFYIGQWDKDVFEWAHLYVWQVLIMLDALIVWLLWLRTLPRNEPAAA
jgi:exosortase H (IPTLxxWG-CTERM-specific)